MFTLPLCVLPNLHWTHWPASCQIAVNSCSLDCLATMGMMGESFCNLWRACEMWKKYNYTLSRVSCSTPNHVCIPAMLFWTLSKFARLSNLVVAEFWASWAAFWAPLVGSKCHHCRIWRYGRVWQCPESTPGQRWPFSDHFGPWQILIFKMKALTYIGCHGRPLFIFGGDVGFFL